MRLNFLCAMPVRSMCCARKFQNNARARPWNDLRLRDKYHEGRNLPSYFEHTLDCLCSTFISKEKIFIKGCSLACVCVCSADGKKKGKVHFNSVYTQQLSAHIVSRTNISLPSRRRSLESRSVYILHLIWLTRMEISYGCDWKILCFCENFSMKLASFKVWRVYLSRPDRHVIDKISHNSYLSVFIVQIRKLNQLLATNFSLRKSIQKVAKPKSKTK